MNKRFVLALMLVSGMAFAQTGVSSGSTPDQQPSQQTSPSTTSPSPTSPSTTGQNSQASPTSSAVTGSDQQSSLRGCLKQSGGNWVLAADNGQSVSLQGDSSMLKPHDGHQVQIQGSRASDGSVQVSSVNMISDSCTSNQSSNTGSSSGAMGAAEATGSAASTTQSAASSTSANPSSSDPSSTASGT